MTISTIADIKPAVKNARVRTERSAGMIAHSIAKNGFGRSVLLAADGSLIAGSGTIDGCAEVGIEDVIVIPSDGTKIIAVQRTDVAPGSERAHQLAIADNRTTDLSVFDPVVVNELASMVDLSDFWREDELDDLAFAAWDAGQIVASEAFGSDTTPVITRADVPDALYATDNDWGVPLLDPSLQARAVDLPVTGWGSTRRRARMPGTWHFYVDDYRFDSLWSDPSPVVNTGCLNIIEPNFSCWTDTPPALALYRIYRKRWLARYWQSHGIRVFVDLNVATPHATLNLLGVPRGWAAFATRAYQERIGALDDEYALAAEIAGAGVTPLFLVIGGGSQARAICHERGWVWSADAVSQKG